MERSTGCLVVLRAIRRSGCSLLYRLDEEIAAARLRRRYSYCLYVGGNPSLALSAAVLMTKDRIENSQELLSSSGGY